MTAPVVVASDGSPHCLAAVEAAAAEAALRGCTVRIVHLFAMPSVPADAGPMMSPRFLLACRDVAQDEVTQAARLAYEHAPGLDITTDAGR